jgi:hypothetical protein
MAISLATAALVVGILAISQPTSSPSPNRTPPAASLTAAGPTDTTSAYRELCEAVGPLLRESNDTGKAFVNLGATGTPPRDAGIPDYEASVLNWVKRIPWNKGCPPPSHTPENPKLLTPTSVFLFEDGLSVGSDRFPFSQRHARIPATAIVASGPNPMDSNSGSDRSSRLERMGSDECFALST